MAAVEPTRRRTAFQQLEPGAWPHAGLSPANRALMAVIVTSTVITIAGTEPEILNGNERLFARLEFVFGMAFMAEYLVRLWAAAENEACGSGWRARWAFATSAIGLIDLFAAVVTLLPWLSGDAALLRLLRLLRIVRLARLGRFSEALRHLTYALVTRRFELALSFGLSLCVMLVGATALWLAEGDVQPEKFGSIPRAMWWAVVTLTTIGYGDVYPVTPLGKVLAGVLAVAGVGLIVLPAGILASAFSDLMQGRRGD